MKERPILFSGAMVRATLDGRKTHTRRIIKPQPQPNGGEGLHPVAPYSTPQGKWTWVLEATGHGDGTSGFWCPYGQPGDRLWVRESFTLTNHGDPIFRADFRDLRGNFWSEVADDPDDIRWKPSIHMRRAHCRIMLEIVAVRVERLQEISEEDAAAEGGLWHDGGGVGHSGWRHDIDHGFVYSTAKDSFLRLWEQINGKGSVQDNPWVWVIEFKRVTKEGLR